MSKSLYSEKVLSDFQIPRFVICSIYVIECGKDMKVLVVDDSRMFRVRLVNLLSTIEGVEDIAEAENGRKAMKLYQADKHELLILDIRMRNDNGIEVLRKVKKEPDAPKVIMLTNFPYPQYRRICMEEGADFFLDKSTEFDEITEIIKELVNQH